MHRQSLRTVGFWSAILAILVLVLVVSRPDAPPIEDRETVASPGPMMPPQPPQRASSRPTARLPRTKAPLLTEATWHELADAITTSLEGFETIRCDNASGIDLTTLDPPVSFLLPGVASKDSVAFIAPPYQLISLTRRGTSEVVAEIAASDAGCVVRLPLRYRLKGKVVITDGTHASTLPMRICGHTAYATERLYSVFAAPNLAQSPTACVVEIDGFVVRPKRLPVPQDEAVTLYVARRTHAEHLQESNRLKDLLQTMKTDHASQAKGRKTQAAFLQKLMDAGGLSAQAEAWVAWKATALARNDLENWEAQARDQVLDALEE